MSQRLGVAKKCTRARTIQNESHRCFRQLPLCVEPKHSVVCVRHTWNDNTIPHRNPMRSSGQPLLFSGSFPLPRWTRLLRLDGQPSSSLEGCGYPVVATLRSQRYRDVNWVTCVYCVAVSMEMSSILSGILRPPLRHKFVGDALM